MVGIFDDQLDGETENQFMNALYCELLHGCHLRSSLLKAGNVRSER